ncbi:Addiction module killer protein [Tumidithrix helvetica PCC 7403]|uniref:type II toxin-antitoxin system RelE/ParE family toxin n=1 Tax=Tumidithrix helvetica TaxID=3457545 RepID=UPI003CAF27D4
MESQPRKVELYQDANGNYPFDEWLEGLRDRTARVKVQARLARLSLGNFGDSKFVGEGVYELRINYGGGYRIYFGQVGARVILLLCGGDKSSQDRDIQTAKSYWRDYAKRKGTGF